MKTVEELKTELAEAIRVKETALRLAGKHLSETYRLKERIEQLKIEVNQAAATSVYNIPGHPRWEWKKDE